MIKIEIAVDTKKVDGHTGLNLKCEVFEGHDGYSPELEKLVVSMLTPMVMKTVNTVSARLKDVDKAIGKAKEETP